MPILRESVSIFERSRDCSSKVMISHTHCRGSALPSGRGTPHHHQMPSPFMHSVTPGVRVEEERATTAKEPALAAGPASTKGPACAKGTVLMPLTASRANRFAERCGLDSPMDLPHPCPAGALMTMGSISGEETPQLRSGDMVKTLGA